MDMYGLDSSVSGQTNNYVKVIGDQAAQRAIELDQKHGVSNRFLQTLQSIDQKYHVNI
jgi:hypothetical protein